MIGLIGIVLVGLSQLIAVQAETSNHTPLAITYVANEGFLIENDGRKILIDALFGGFDADWCAVPSDSIVELMTSSRPPFDNINVIAITHAHVDHFNPKIAVAHMMSNHDGIMICPPQVADQMAAVDGFEGIRDRLRIIPAPGDTAAQVDIKGIKIEVFPTRHNVSMRTDTLTGETYDRHRDVQHLEYLFRINGWTLYHGGDSPQYDINKDGGEHFGLNRRSIDVAFLQWWGEWSELSRRQKWAREILRPDRIIFMHLRPGRHIPEQPADQTPVAREVIRPDRAMQHWVFK